MARLQLINQTKAQATVDEMLKDVQRRLSVVSDGVCPLDAVSSFLKACNMQSCGKCVPCRIGLGVLQNLIDGILDGNGKVEDVDLIKQTAQGIYDSADCAIGYEAASLVLKAVEVYHDDFMEHINNGRCLSGVKNAIPCVSGCPAGVDIPGYVSLVNAKKYKDAVKLIRKDNPFPSVCGLICEHPCEKKCRRTILDSAVNIRGLKRFAVEHAGEVEMPEIMPSTGKKIAVIGGGPGGLTAAYYLAIMGHSVTVFEEKKYLGGMLRYGIPGYRLPRETLQKEIDGILSLGIKVEHKNVGKDITLAQLKNDFDALYISIGAQTDKKIGIEGEDAKGVLSAVDMLREIGDGIYPDFSGQDIVVIGGGNVAMDVARSSIRLGAKSVKIVYRRRKEDMTAQREEVDGALEEGCEVIELQAPLKIEKDADGNAVALWTEPQIIGEYDRGRPKPNKADAEPVRIPCDKVLVAIGQGIITRELESEGVPIKRGCIDALSTCDVKDNDKIFAGGDCVTGPATVIKAIAAGKVAAANIDEYLGYNHAIKVDVDIPENTSFNKPHCGRVNMSERPAEVRKKDFALMECGMTEEEAAQESGRCLRCDRCGMGSFKGGRQIKW